METVEEKLKGLQEVENKWNGKCGKKFQKNLVYLAW